MRVCVRARRVRAIADAIRGAVQRNSVVYIGTYTYTYTSRRVARPRVYRCKKPIRNTSSRSTSARICYLTPDAPT